MAKYNYIHRLMPLILLLLSALMHISYGYLHYHSFLPHYKILHVLDSSKFLGLSSPSRDRLLYFTSLSTSKIPLNLEINTSCSSCDESSSSNTINGQAPPGGLLLVDPTTEPNMEELSNRNLVLIVNLNATDREANMLVWKCLGYRLVKNLDDTTQQCASASSVLRNIGTYDASKVFPKWRDRFPTPPDLIGEARIYGPEVDKPVRDAVMALMRSVPRDFKGGVRTLESEGFKGYKLSELTPNKTRRAQVVNWLLYYRENLFGKSFEQLQAEREAARVLDAAKLISGDEEAKRVSSLPSEVWYQQLRLDETGADAPRST